MCVLPLRLADSPAQASLALAHCGGSWWKMPPVRERVGAGGWGLGVGAAAPTPVLGSWGSICRTHLFLPAMWTRPGAGPGLGPSSERADQGLMTTWPPERRQMGMRCQAHRGRTRGVAGMPPAPRAWDKGLLVLWLAILV